MENYLFQKNDALLRLETLEVAKEGLLFPADDHYRMLWLTGGDGRLQIDLETLPVSEGTMYFFSTHQVAFLEKNSCLKGWMITFNKEFYCIELHDEEVSCNGLLFNNQLTVPQLCPETEGCADICRYYEEMRRELCQENLLREEALRIWLKMLIIKCSRLYRKTLPVGCEPLLDDFGRQFIMLIDKHFLTHRRVADLASLLHITPKALHKRLSILQLPPPSQLLQDRLSLEAKRLLRYSPSSVKEIAYQLGFEDPAYFSRFFKKTAGCPPEQFRSQHLS